MRLAENTERGTTAGRRKDAPGQFKVDGIYKVLLRTATTATLSFLGTIVTLAGSAEYEAVK